MRQNTPGSAISKWLKPADLGFLVVWLFSGGLLLWKVGYHTYFFPILLFIWLLALALWVGMSRRKWTVILIGPFLTTLACLLLTLVYWQFASREAERALHEFVRYVVAGQSSLEFTLSDGGPSLAIMSEDFAPDYTIVGRDRFGVENEWAVRFNNGSEYLFVMAPVSWGRWDVSVLRTPKSMSTQKEIQP